jgi:hypothetical protein
MLTEPCGSAVGVEVVNLYLVSSCSSRKQALSSTYIHVDRGVEVSIEIGVVQSTVRGME